MAFLSRLGDTASAAAKEFVRGYLRAADAPADEYREIVVATASEWPTPEELELRDVIERSIRKSGAAEWIASDQGAGTITVFVRLRTESEHASASRAGKRRKGRA